MEISYKHADSPKPGDYHLFKGIDEFNKKRYGQALYCFQTASSLLFENEIAMLLVASMYLIGFGNIKKNSYRALEYYKKAAYVHNNRIAQYFVGMMYLEGGRDDASNFIEQDHEAAVIWLNKSAINGWCTAQVRLGLLYQMGDAGLNQDYDQAAYWYKKTAQKYKASRDTLCLFGNKNFQLHFESSGLLKALKVICNERLITPAQIVEASIKNRQHEGGILQREQAAISLKNMVQQALFFYSTSNNLWEIPICQFSLGNIYKYINTRDGEEDMSNIYMMRAAQNGHRYAQCFAMIHRKDGTSFKDFNLVCLAWYAYSQTNSVLDNALIRLGNHHNHAISSRDAVNTRREFQSILENIQDNNMSIAEGLCIAGGILEHKEDYKMAMKHYKRSVKQEEFGLGATLVGRLYELGRGVESSYKKAYKWYLLGASRNCPIAYFSLAWMYVNGCYVNTDLDFALNLLERSQKNGLNKESAQEGVDLVNIIKSMSSNQKDIPQEIYDRFKQIAFLHKLMK